MTKLARMLLVAAVLTTGCGDDGGGPGPDSGAGEQDSGGGSCPNLAGDWTITAHCGGAPLIGMTVPITQADCTITTSGAFPDFTGTVASDGSFMLAGTANGVAVSCNGVALGNTITESCMPSCDVTLTK